MIKSIKLIFDCFFRASGFSCQFWFYISAICVHSHSTIYKFYRPKNYLQIYRNGRKILQITKNIGSNLQSRFTQPPHHSTLLVSESTYMKVAPKSTGIVCKIAGIYPLIDFHCNLIRENNLISCHSCLKGYSQTGTQFMGGRGGQVPPNFSNFRSWGGQGGDFFLENFVTYI